MKNKTSIIFYLFLLITQYKFVEDDDILVEYNCAVEFSDDNLYEQGKELTLCLHFIPQQLKTMFKVQVDRQQLLTSTSSFEKFSNQSTDFLLQVQNSDVFSSPFAYIRQDNDKPTFQVYPFISVILHLEQGVFMNFEYEDLESACERYVEATKLNKYNIYYDIIPETITPRLCEYSSNEMDKINGNVLIMITWTGTDKNSNVLTSSLRSFKALQFTDQKFRLNKLLEANQKTGWDEFEDEENTQKPVEQKTAEKMQQILLIIFNQIKISFVKIRKKKDNSNEW